MKPILIHLFGEPIFSYPLLMGLGWGIGFNVVQAYWEKANLSKKSLWLLFLGTFISGWVGAKIFFLLFSAPDRVLDYSKEVNFWLGGGFVFYGGLVFAGLFALCFTFFKKELAPTDLALITPGLALGHGIGRIGCALAGCCFGSHCDLPIAVSFKGELRHPVQIYEFIGLMILFFILRKWVKEKNYSNAMNGYLIGYAILRFVLEFFRGDEVRGLFSGLSTSQWVSICIVAGSLTVNLLVKKLVTR